MNIVEFIETCADEDLRVALVALSCTEEGTRDAVRWFVADQQVVGDDGSEDGMTVAHARWDDPGILDHVALHDPQRALAEVSAIRTVVADRFRHFETVDGEWGCCHDVDAIRAGECADNTPEDLDCDSTFRALARIWGDRPEFEPRWLEDA